MKSLWVWRQRVRRSRVQGSRKRGSHCSLTDPLNKAKSCKEKRNISSFIATNTFTETRLKITNSYSIELIEICSSVKIQTQGYLSLLLQSLLSIYRIQQLYCGFKRSSRYTIVSSQEVSSLEVNITNSTGMSISIAKYIEQYSQHGENIVLTPSIYLYVSCKRCYIPSIQIRFWQPRLLFKE